MTLLRRFGAALVALAAVYACNLQDDVSLGANPGGTAGAGATGGAGGAAGASVDASPVDAGGDASDSGSPCWGLTEPMPDPKTTAEHACNAIISGDLLNLDYVFGAYAKGEIPGYQGTVQALDTATSESLSGNARAQIVRIESPPEGPAWALQITVPGSKRWLQLSQFDADPSKLVIVPFSEYCCAGFGGVSVDAGGVSLAAAPSDLVLDLAPPAPATVSVSASFTKLSMVPATFAVDFEHSGAWDFAVEGDELVRHRSNWTIAWSTDAPPRFAGWGCSWQTTYALDQWVRIDEPAVWGVRNVVLNAAQFCCATDCVNEHCYTGVCCPERETCEPTTD